MERAPSVKARFAMNSPLVITPEQVKDLGGLTLGGKATGLLHLCRAGLPVPTWYVIPAEIAENRPWRQSGYREVFLDCFRALNPPLCRGVAVRSSAVGEDAMAASHAGIFETCFAADEGAFIDALDRVMDAANSVRARCYRGAGSEARMAIVVQAAVRPDWAGILFSADPAAALPDRFYIEVVRGRGEGLVNGTKSPTRSSLSIETGALLDVAFGADGPDTLTPALASTLRDTLLQVEGLFDAPVDIEWAAEGERLWILQARPITALQPHASLRPSSCASSWFFDQRFLEPISPLTRTTLLPIILRVAVEDALRMRGQETPLDMLHFFAGQAYVAHEAYRRMFAGAPRWLLSGDLRQLFPDRCACGDTAMRSTPFRYLSSAVRAMLRYPGDALFNLSAWTRFRRELPVLLSKIPNPSPKDSHAWVAAWRALDRLNERFLQLHRWSLLWADYGFRIYHFLVRCLPGRARAAIEQRLHEDMRLVTRDANAALARVVAGKATKTEVADFLEQYGNRSTSLDYAVPTWREWHAEGVLEQRYPDATTQALARALRNPSGRSLLSMSLLPLRRALEMREEQRFEWERILSRQRAMLLEAGAMLTGRGVISRAEDVWLLKWSELFECLEGRGAPALATLEMRCHVLRLESRMDKPPFIGPRTEIPRAAVGRELRGIGASGGVARGRVRLLRGPARSLAAESAPIIAVLAALDPSWTIVLPQVAGVVVERGGMLSHAAILAREYRVPLVIGVHDAASHLREDDEVSVNGETGIVTMIDGRRSKGPVLSTERSGVT